MCIRDRYLDAAVDTESGAGFNTLDDKDQVSTDGDEDDAKDNPSSGGKRGRGMAGDDDSNKGKKTRSSEFAMGIARLERIGEAMMESIKSSALELRGGYDGRVKDTGDEVDALEMTVAAFKSMPECTPAALQ